MDTRYKLTCYKATLDEVRKEYTTIVTEDRLWIFLDGCYYDGDNHMYIHHRTPHEIAMGADDTVSRGYTLERLSNI